MLTRSHVVAALATLAIAASARAASSPISMSATASPNVVRLGEEFLYQVELRDTKEVRYELPKDLNLGKEFEVVRVETTREAKGDETVTRFAIRAALFDLGENRLADLELAVIGSPGAERLAVPGPTVTGLGDLKDDAQEQALADIMPPVEVKVTRYTVLWVAAALIAGSLLALVAYRNLKARPRKARPAPPPPPRAPAHERALAALEELQREDLPARGCQKELHLRLSEILRDYLGERFGVAALDMTTEELLAALARTPTPGLDYPRFEALCREGDLVKFAKLVTTPTQCKVALEAGFAMVRATAPRGENARSDARRGAAV